jgi:ABC-type antimicrobial peptide transport system permease subunit
VSIRKMLLAALVPHLPFLLAIFGAIIGVTLMVMSVCFDNAAIFFPSIVITAVLPPILEAVGNSLKEKYETIQNEVDIIAMIPEWLLGLEMLSSIAIIVVSAVLKDFVIWGLGAWLLALGCSLSMAKEINDLKEDLRSPDLEKRRTAMEEVEFDEWAGAMIALALLLCDLVIFSFSHASFTPVEFAIMVALLFTFPLPALIVFEQSYKVMPPEPEKATEQPHEVGA